MSDNQSQLTALRALRNATIDPFHHAVLDAAITALQSQSLPGVSMGSGNQMGDVTMGDIAAGDVRKGIEGGIELSADARINGVAVGVNLGTIIYRRDPAEEERRQLTRYLVRLAAKLRRLPLSGLAARLDDGEGVAMERVYIQLATNNITERIRGYLAELTTYLEPNPKQDIRSWIKASYHPDLGLPANTISTIQLLEAPEDPRYETVYILWRALLATEAVRDKRQLIFLGDPGSGKSTFLRHLSWALAQRGLDQLDNRTQLLGWANDERLLPVLLPLRRLAGQISSKGTAPAVVSTTLVHEMEREYGARDAADLLDRALTTGSALLLLDGLDEVPFEATPTSASRLDTLRAVRAIVDLYPDAKIVITCRTRAFSDELRGCLGWDVEMFAPFTLGQIRHFIQAWFDTLHTRGSFDQDKANQYAQALTNAVVASKHLRRMAETPLLLTMMALVLVEHGELPRDRPLLYEGVLRQLLGEWDVQKGGESLAEVLGASNLRSVDLRPILDRLSFEAHARATSEDGRGRLPARDLRLTLTEYLEKVRVPGAWEAAGRCLTYFSERSGLLLPEDDGSSYAFAHLTLQEHGAGRHLLLQPNAVQTVMERRADERWREPISLGLGVAQRLHPMLADRIDRIFAELIDPDEGGRPKERVRWYHDLLLAAELGTERDWNLLRALINVDRLQRDLKKGMVALLADESQPLPIAERVRVGFLLGELGDPRYPVTIEQWRDELNRRTQTFGLPIGYFCYVRGDTYRIGGWETDQDAADITLEPFWLARFPITVAQYGPFVAAGYGRDAEHWWTETGWKWKPSERLTKPWSWRDSPYNEPNQPTIGISWYEATAFCSWLTDQLYSVLPSGYVIRLPTEAEWEAAAAYDETSQRQPYPWGEDVPDPERAIYDVSKRGCPTPVGCYPAGAAACGALDMAGNVLELTTSSYRGYPAQSNMLQADFTTNIEDVPQRGGAWALDSSFIHCGTRSSLRPGGRVNQYLGFRIVIAHC